MNRARSVVWVTLAAGLTIGSALLLAESGGAPPGTLALVPPIAAPSRMPPAVRAPGTTFDARTPAQAREVIAFTGRASSDDAAALRAMALGAESPLVAGNALRALGRLGAVADDEALLALLDDPRPRVRQELVRALGASNAPAAVDLLAQVVAGDEASLRPIALTALGHIGNDPARALLENVRDDPRAAPVDRVFARQALDAPTGDGPRRAALPGGR